MALPLDARARAAQRVLELVGRCGGSGVVLVGVKWRWSQLLASQGSRIALVAAGLAALGACGASTQDDPADTARDAPWTLLGVSKGGRSLRVAYDQSGCWRGVRAAVTVRESANGVELDLRQTREPSDSCTDSIATGLLSVALKDPIGGRLVSGGPRLRPGARLLARQRGADAEGHPRLVVPRVVGLAAANAARALRVQKFGARFSARPPGRVSAQTPKPGRAITWTGKGVAATVRLTLAD